MALRLMEGLRGDKLTLTHLGRGPPLIRFDSGATLLLGFQRLTFLVHLADSVLSWFIPLGFGFKRGRQPLAFLWIGQEWIATTRAHVVDELGIARLDTPSGEP